MTETAVELTTIEQSVRIAATPETIWTFWTEPALLAEWLGVAEILPEPGGLFRVAMDNGHTMRGNFIELDPPNRFAITFGWEQNEGQLLAPGTTRVDVTITPDGAETVVQLRHSEMPTTHAADHSKGWQELVCERLPAAIAAA